MAGRRILITGVGSYIGSELAERLIADPGVEYVVGLDQRNPNVAELEFIEADLRDPVITTLIPRHEVDTVVHNQIVRRPGPNMSTRTMHDINVIGTLQLLAACERAPSINAIVIRGSAGIYGSEPQAPQFFGEQLARLFPLRTRFQRDVGEIENLFETYAGRHRDVVCTMLRYQPAIGPGLDTQITRYLAPPVAPTFLGFDPRLQVVHSEDGLGALLATIHNPVPGAVNVASPGTIGLHRMIHRAGRAPLPIAAPLFDRTAGALGRLGIPSLSDDFSRLLRYGRAVDTTRLTTEIGFQPRYTTAAAIEEWADTRSMPGAVPA